MILIDVLSLLSNELYPLPNPLIGELNIVLASKFLRK